MGFNFHTGTLAGLERRELSLLRRGREGRLERAAPLLALLRVGERRWAAAARQVRRGGGVSADAEYCGRIDYRAAGEGAVGVSADACALTVDLRASFE